MTAARKLFWILLLLPVCAGTVQGQTIAEALDAPGLIWSNPAGTLVQNDVTFDGVDAVQLARTGTATLSTTLTGPARLEMRVRVSTEENADWFEASIGGLVVARLSGEHPWQTVKLDIPAGSQRVDLFYRKDVMTAHGADAVWVDAVQVMPAQPLSIAEAVDADFPGDITITPAMAAWFTLPAPELSAEGGDVLVLAPSPATATAAAARLRLPVTGRGALSFALKYVGAGMLGSVTPEFPLRSRSYYLPTFTTGSYSTVEFIQPLNAPVPAVEFVITIPSGMIAFVDQVKWTPFSSVSIGAALETETLPWQAAGGVLPLAKAAYASDSVDAVLLYDASAAVSLALTSPAQVRWSSLNDPLFTVDGVTLTRSSTIVAALPGGWEGHKYFVPPGNRTLRWQTKGTLSTPFDQHGRLDTVTVTPLTMVSIAEAADAPGLTWTTAPNTTLGGIGGGGDAVQDGDAVRCMVIRPTTDWVEAAGSGAGRLSFAWSGVMTCGLNGFTALSSSGRSWQHAVLEVPAGGWATRWATAYDDTLIPGLDAVTFVPGAGETLSSITDCPPGISVVAASGWRSVETVEGWEGATGRQLLLQGSPKVTLQTTVAGNLRARVWAAAGTVISWGAGQVTTVGGWQDVEFPISAPYAGKFRMTLSTLSGDLLAVDSITWATGSTYSSEEAMDTPGVSWVASQTGNTEGWVGRAVPLSADNPGDGDAMMVPDMAFGATADLSATVTGSGWLTFARSLPFGVSFSVLVNGVQVFTGSTTSTWERAFVELAGPGPHQITFRVSRVGGSSTGQSKLNDVGIVPWVDVPGGGAAEVPAGIPLRTSPWRRYRADRASTYAGRAEIVAVLPTSEFAVLELEVNGPAWVSCDALGSSLQLDGAVFQYLNCCTWTTVLMPLSPGPHKIRIFADSRTTGALDNFSRQPASAATIGEALDQPDWTWTVQGPWSASVPDLVAHDGADAASFTSADSSSTGSLRTPWPGAGLLSFWWKRAGSGPQLTFTAGGETRSDARQDEWRQEFILLSAAGGTELVWSVDNGQQFSSTSQLLVDDVRFRSCSSVSLAEALDTPGLIWTTGTPAWQTLSDGLVPGEAADYAITPPGTGLRYLETTVTHPVWVEYDTVAAGVPEVTSPPAGWSLQNNLLQPNQTGAAPGWVRRRIITGGSGAGTLRFSGTDDGPYSQARLLDRVFIGASVPATEALDSPVPWTNTYGADGAGFRLNRPLADGDAIVVQLQAITGELSTTLTGPGEFALHWMTEWGNAPAPGTVAARVFLDGAVVQEITSAAEWRELRHRVPAGSHRLSLVNVRLTNGMLLLDDFRFTPGGTDAVALALDLAGSYGSAGSGWTTHTDATATGGTALRSPDAAADGTMQTAALVFTGAGSLGFSWQFQSAAGAAFTLLLDGEPFWTAPPAAAWTTATLPVPCAGGHTLTLQWQQAAGSAFALMDAVTLTPFTSVSVETALDTTGRTWEVKHCDGVAGAAAGTVNGDALRLTADPAFLEDARLSTTVTGPARVSFRWYRAAARSSPGFSPPTLSFSAQGFCSLAASKVQQWEQVSLDVPSGVFTLDWQALAASGGTPLCALVDDVSITPVTLPLTLAAALDVPAGVTVTGSASAWKLVTAPSVQGDDAVIGIDNLAPLNLTFSGPGEMEFTCALPVNATPAFNVTGTAAPPPMETVWRQRGALFGRDLGRFRLPFALQGSRTVSLYASGNATLFMLDDVTWRPAVALTLADALDTPGQTWTTGTAPSWQALPFPPSRINPAAGDVAYIVNGTAATGLETSLSGAYAISVSGVEGGAVKALVNGTETSRNLGADTVFLMLPGAQSLRLLPAGSPGTGLSIESVILTPNARFPAWLAGAGVNVTAGPGLWRTQPAAGTVPAPALLAFASGGVLPALTAQVEGAGALEFYASGASLTVDEVLQVTLNSSGAWQRHRLELPAAGPHTITFTFTSGGLADLRWTPGPPVIAAVLGLSGAALFVPSDAITLLPGGGVCVDVPEGRTGLIAVASNEPALYTWWQQAGTAAQVKSPGNTNLFSLATAAEAGPPPAPANGLSWVPRRMVWTMASDSMSWLLSGAVCMGNIRLTPQSVPLAEALELPPGVVAAAVWPGSAAGYARPAATGGDVVGLRAGSARALQLTASGPGILSYYTTGGLLRITVGTGPPVDVLNGFGHVLLGPGPQTVIFGNQPGTTTIATMDNVALLPLPFDPIAALGGAMPLLVTSGTGPANWPFVTSGGAVGLLLPGNDSLYTAASGPARLSYNSGAGTTTTYFTNYLTPPAQLSQSWTSDVRSLWLDRAVTARILTGSTSPLAFVDGVHLDAAPAVTFPQALDADGLTFIASAGVLAHALPQSAVYGGDAAAFALGTAARTLQTQVTGPGRLRFWWRTLTPQANAITCQVGSSTAVSQDTSVWKQADLAVPAGAQAVVWTVTANLASAELDRVEFFPQWTFATWAAQNALASLPANTARAADDSDGDGAAGLLEFAFGLDPGAADFALFTGSLTGLENARGLPALHVARALDGRDYLELHFPRRLNAGLTYQMQAATGTAASWQDTGTLEWLRPLGADWELWRTRDTLPLDPARPLRLVRLRVTQP